MRYVVQMLFEYHHETFDRVWGVVENLTTEQFVCESRYSWPSARNQLVDCMSGDYRWLARLQGEAPPAHFEFSEYPDQATLRIQWIIIRNAVLQYARSLTAGHLEQDLILQLWAREEAWVKVGSNPPRFYPRCAHC